MEIFIKLVTLLLTSMNWNVIRKKKNINGEDYFTIYIGLNQETKSIINIKADIICEEVQYHLIHDYWSMYDKRALFQGKRTFLCRKIQKLHSLTIKLNIKIINSTAYNYMRK
eukprot:63716_1